MFSLSLLKFSVDCNEYKLEFADLDYQANIG